MNLLPSPYAPGEESAKGQLYVLEGVSGIGKSTLTALLAERMDATTLHTLPEPLTSRSTDINKALRPLPQLGFYLSGVLHASDLIRAALSNGHVVADRYVSSVIACHSAIHGVDLDQVTGFLEPFRPYLALPIRTFYLRASETALRERLERKPDTKQDDTELFGVPGRLARLLANFDTVAATDPSAVILDTDNRTPGELVDEIMNILEADDA